MGVKEERVVPRRDRREERDESEGAERRGERGLGTWLPRRTDGKYRLQKSFGAKPDGRRDRKVFVGNTKQDCREQAIEYQKAKRRGLVPISGEDTLADYLASWLERRRPPRLERKTYETWEVWGAIIPSGRLALVLGGQPAEDGPTDDPPGP